MKKILFPLAFSANAKHNFLYALDWAEKFDAKLIVLHALGMPEAVKSGNKDWNELASDSMDKMTEFVEEHRPDKYANVKIEYTVQVGFPTDAIEIVVNEDDINMIIMGMRAHPTAIEAYFSSVAFDVVSRMDIPVLLIPNTNRFDEIKNMTYTFDFAFKELVVINKLLRWCKKIGTTISCLHILENNENQDVKEIEFSTIKDLYKQNKKYKEIIGFDMSFGSFEEMVQFKSKEEDMDLLVMLSHKRNFKTRYVEPSTASKIARKMDIPVLILKEEYIFSHKPFGGKKKILA